MAATGTSGQPISKFVSFQPSDFPERMQMPELSLAPPTHPIHAILKNVIDADYSYLNRLQPALDLRIMLVTPDKEGQKPVKDGKRPVVALMKPTPINWRAHGVWGRDDLYRHRRMERPRRRREVRMDRWRGRVNRALGTPGSRRRPDLRSGCLRAADHHETTTGRRGQGLQGGHGAIRDRFRGPKGTRSG